MKLVSGCFPIADRLSVDFSASRQRRRTGSARARTWATERIRLAAADFKPVGADPQTPALKATFDATLYSDLDNAGIFDLVSKSLAPQATPGSPQEMIWRSGRRRRPTRPWWLLARSRRPMGGWWSTAGSFDTSNTANPQVLGKQYNEAASQDMARTVAHRFADEIISRLGGGINGIAETKIYFVSSRSGTKEIWVMDYDGENQHPSPTWARISLSPRISPDNSRLAFASLGKRRLVDPHVFAGAGPAGELSRRNGGREQPVAGVVGATEPRLPSRRRGRAIRRSGWRMRAAATCTGHFSARARMFRRRGIRAPMRRLAWVSGRTGEPQIYIMDQDGANIQRMTDGGYAVSPSWSPNGQLLTFSWNRKYGPGDPGGQDIYVMDIASKRWLQVTHEAGNNDFPSWSPDGRHIVFERPIGGHTEIWTMLADGTEQQQLTQTGQQLHAQLELEVRDQWQIGTDSVQSNFLRTVVLFGTGPRAACYALMDAGLNSVYRFETAAVAANRILLNTLELEGVTCEIRRIAFLFRCTACRFDCRCWLQEEERCRSAARGHCAGGCARPAPTAQTYGHSDGDFRRRPGAADAGIRPTPPRSRSTASATCPPRA